MIRHHPHALFHTLSFLSEPPTSFPSALFAEALLPMTLGNKSNPKSTQLPQALTASHVHSPACICGPAFTFPLTVSELAVPASGAKCSPLTYSSSLLQEFAPLYCTTPISAHTYWTFSHLNGQKKTNLTLHPSPAYCTISSAPLWSKTP